MRVIAGRIAHRRVAGFWRRIETVLMPIFEPRMNKCFTPGSAHEDEVTPRRVATNSPSGENDHDQAYCVFRRHPCDIRATSGRLCSAHRRHGCAGRADPAGNRSGDERITESRRRRPCGCRSHSRGRPEHENSPVRYEGEKAFRESYGEIGCRQYPPNQCRALSPAGRCRHQG
jgi:hypothetical protein